MNSLFLLIAQLDSPATKPEAMGYAILATAGLITVIVCPALVLLSYVLPGPTETDSAKR